MTSDSKTERELEPNPPAVRDPSDGNEENVMEARVLDSSIENVEDRVRPKEEDVVDRETKEECELKYEGNSIDQLDPEGDKFDAENEHSASRKTDLWSQFDEFIANEKNEAMAGTSRALSYGFEVGDMVWGKVKSHPWWPGHIFNQEFASASVKRTRREGHVLVAFFGDSSYGWFDPAELIPFDINFAEKSLQTNSRNFVKAVEEAVDEASRRRGLGLICRCRNANNFRPTCVQGYFAVDVPDYEPGGVYSVNQIKNARDAFQPIDALAFVKQLALAPQESDSNDIDFSKNKATVFALRKARFEENDSTYAQAFGVQAARASNDVANPTEQPVKEPTRAPLSGPLVIAETLGGGKSSKKTMKLKDPSKTDRYLLKRRDEPTFTRTPQIGQMQAGSSAAVYVESLSVIEAGDYVLQKRASAPHIMWKDEPPVSISEEVAGPNKGASEKLALAEDESPGHVDVLSNQGSIFDLKPSSDEEKVYEKNTGDSITVDAVIGATNTGSDVSGDASVHISRDGILPSFTQDSEIMINSRRHESANALKSIEGSQQTDLIFSKKVEGENVLQKAKDDEPSALDAKHPPEIAAEAGVKKAKVPKRPLGDLTSEKLITKDKRMKKKKVMNPQMTPAHPKKHLIPGKVGVVSAKSSQMVFPPREEPRGNHQKKDISSSISSSNYSSKLPTVAMGKFNLDLSQLLSDLHGLALDPFYGVETNGPSITMQFLLHFRSLVYQKSLVLSPLPETELVEVQSRRSPSSVGAPDGSTIENVRDSVPLKSVKPPVRPEDPTKAGRKRMPSDRQEEMAKKRLKKIYQLKLLAGEKKSNQSSESPRVEVKESSAMAPQKSVRPDSVKKMDPPARTVEPTMLLMKFPPQTSLPSVAELKARFARFGSMDQSAIRVFWKSSQCRVVFRHRSDAEAAYRYAVGNRFLFGNVSVRYTVREVGATAPDSEKGRGDDISMEAARLRDPPTEPAATLTSLSLPTMQPKSILKKPTGDDVGQVAGGNGGRGTSRVKFMLGGQESSREGQLMGGNGNRNNFNNNASFADGGASTSVAMDFNSKNFQNVIPSTSLPVLPMPTQFAKAPLGNPLPTEVAPRNLHNYGNPGLVPNNPVPAEQVPRNLHNVGNSIAMPNNPLPAELAPRNLHNFDNHNAVHNSMDVSKQMLSLLTKCNDVVNRVTGLLGYTPYHPL
ncbi:hypothetical protein K2173_004748 [Erythroxylum novogranatense]|uniref:PWWP domain-containing protein n=1 Tax=Erythroxylum novogranatense TaxID=1862640 RepID=A0AAV8SKN6_9ROSI|nr:hypothetical protein K2173_004748 [Erythroxylum novogranatense]